MAHPLADRFDHARSFEPGRVRESGLHDILALTEARIREVDPDGLIFDQHLTGSEFGNGRLAQFQHLGSADCLKQNCFHIALPSARCVLCTIPMLRPRIDGGASLDCATSGEGKGRGGFPSIRLSIFGVSAREPVRFRD